VSFREVVSVLCTRWYVVMAVFLVTALASWPVYHPKPEYQASVVLVLTPPVQPGVPNALAAATPSIAATGQAVDLILQSQVETQNLRQAGVTDQYALAPYNSGTDETPAYTIPSEQLTVSSADPNFAVHELTVLSNAFYAKLQSMQAGVDVPVKAQITAGLLAQPSVAELHGAKSRGLAGMMLLGLGFAVALPLWLDRWLVRRAVRRSAKRVPASAAAAGLQGV
jgi:hypothetical protein